MAGAPVEKLHGLPPVGYLRCPNCGLVQLRVRPDLYGRCRCVNAQCQTLFNASEASGWYARGGLPTSKTLAKLYPATPVEDYPPAMAQPEALAEEPTAAAESLAVSALQSFASSSSSEVAPAAALAAAPQRRKRKIGSNKPKQKRAPPNIVNQKLQARAERAEAKVSEAQQLATRLTERNFRLEQENKTHVQTLAFLATRQMSIGSVSQTQYNDLNVRYMALQATLRGMQSAPALVPAPMVEELERVKKELAETKQELEIRRQQAEALQKRVDISSYAIWKALAQEEYEPLDIDSDIDEEDWPDDVKIDKLENVILGYRETAQKMYQKYYVERGEMRGKQQELEMQVSRLKEKLAAAQARNKKLLPRQPGLAALPAPRAPTGGGAGSSSGLSLSMEEQPDAEPEIERGTSSRVN